MRKFFIYLVFGTVIIGMAVLYLNARNEGGSLPEDKSTSARQNISVDQWVVIHDSEDLFKIKYPPSFLYLGKEFEVYGYGSFCHRNGNYRSVLNGDSIMPIDCLIYTGMKNPNSLDLDTYGNRVYTIGRAVNPGDTYSAIVKSNEKVRLGQNEWIRISWDFDNFEWTNFLYYAMNKERKLVEFWITVEDANSESIRRAAEDVLSTLEFSY